MLAVRGGGGGGGGATILLTNVHSSSVRPTEARRELDIDRQLDPGCNVAVYCVIM